MATTYKSLAQDGSGGLDYGIFPTAMAAALNKLAASLNIASRVTNYTGTARVQGAQFGGSVRVPQLASVAVQSKAPGTGVTPTAAPLTKTDLAINQHKTWDILLEDYGVLFNPAIVQEYLSDGALSIAESIEAELAGLYTGASRVIGAPTGGMTQAKLASIAKYALNDKWRQTQPKIGVLGPEATEDLLNVATFTDVASAGRSDTQYNAVFGQKFGFDLIKSNQMASIAGSPGAEHNLFFQREGIGLAFIDLSENGIPAELQNVTAYKSAMDWTDEDGVPIYTLRMIVSYDQVNRGYLLSVDTIFGAGVVRSALVYDVLV